MDYKTFKKELEENDKKVGMQPIIGDSVEMAKEFAAFIKQNNCMIMGEENGKKKK